MARIEDRRLAAERLVPKYRRAVEEFFRVLDEHAVPANEEVLRLWNEAQAAGVSVELHAWGELFGESAGLGSILELRRRQARLIGCDV